MIGAQLELFSDNGTRLAVSRRSIILPYRSQVLQLLDTVAYAIPLLLGIRHQEYTTSIR